MKKIGKGFSFLTKIMLVIGLLISNLSSLSLVFADEATDMVQITVVDDKLNIKYLGELAEEVENVNVNVYENYTYLDDTLYYVDEYATEAGRVSNYSLTSEELLDSEGYLVESILNNIIFDGLYEVKVEITDTNNEVIDSAIYSENIAHDSGLVVKVFDSADVEILPSSTGVYSVTETNSKIKVVSKILAGGLNPTDEFTYEDEGFMAADLLNLEFKSEMDYNGYLFGEYTLPVAVKILNSNMEEVTYDSSLNIMYEDYAKNTSNLNNKTSELLLEDSYEFVGESKNGKLNILLDSTKANTLLDLYNIVNSVYGDSEIISYVISNSEYEDVLSTYDAELLGVSLEEYLETMLLDDTTVLTLSNDGLTVTYNVVVVGDTNGDNVINQDDLLGLVDQVIGETETDLEKSDFNQDGLVDVLDVMYLDQVAKNESWDVTLEEVEATVDANLVLNGTDIVSGDEFTVDYVLSVSDYAVNGVAGLFTYDETMLELVSMEVKNDWLGNYKNGKFLYLGTDSLTGNVTIDEETEEEVITPEDYVIVTATFKALKSGESEVSVEEREYINQNQYLNVVNELEPIIVVVNASDNNNLSSLTVAGQVIELLEDVFEYKITVSNDVTVADVEAILENVAASITSIVAPEELVEGENTITITVTAENGDEKVYTVVVNREEAVKEETTTQVNYNNYYNDYEEDNTEELPIVDTDEDEEEEEEPVKEEESNLSRIVIIILILLVIAGLIYLIFKDEDDDETKKTNKDINRLKKEKEELDVKVEKNTDKAYNKPTNNYKNKKPNNKK